MAKENLKLVSCRIDPKTLERIDDFTSKRYYWKRNSVINAVLTNVFALMSDKDIYDLVRHYSREGESISIQWNTNDEKGI